MFVITGGGSGIGRALALQLAALGKSVLIIGRRLESLMETAISSPLISILCADISLASGREKIVAYLQSVDDLEGLIHNAGIIDPIALLGTIDEEAWLNALMVNLNAPLFLSQLLQRQLNKGRVLHIGSGAAHFPVAGWASYCVSKAALSMLTRCWQLEGSDIAFACVQPGIIDTDMQALIRQNQVMDPEKVDFFKQLKQSQRLLTPATVGLFLSWLLLDVGIEEYSSQEWDIYDVNHHSRWLVSPHRVPHWESL